MRRKQDKFSGHLCRFPFDVRPRNVKVNLSVVSGVKMLNNRSYKAKTIQSRVCKQNNCPSFGNKGRLSHIPTYEMKHEIGLPPAGAETNKLITKHGHRRGFVLVYKFTTTG